MSDQELHAIPLKELQTLTNLFSLKLNNNHVDTLSLGKLFDSEVGPRLETLEVNNNMELTAISSSIKKMKALVHFQANNCSITELADEIKHCTALQTLQLNKNQLDMVPNDLPKTLKTLSVASNNIMSLPSALLEKLTELEDLNVSHNLLNNLSAKIPTTFKSINIGHNNVQVLPWKELSACKNLETLLVNDNGIKQVPRLLGDITTLTKLDLSRNPIDEIPLGIFTSMKNLRVLHLEGLPIRSLPDLPNSIEELYLDGCTNITVLPESILQLSKLRVLKMGATGLKHIPESITRLQTLETISFRDCTLLLSTTFGFTSMQKLRHLDMRGCTKLYDPPAIITDKGHHLLLMGYMSGQVTAEDAANPAFCTIL